MIKRLINSIRTDIKAHHFLGEGLITVEATLVFPLFFFCIWMFWQLFLLLLYEVDVAKVIAKTNPTIQAMGCALRESGGENVENIEKMYASVLTTALIFRVDSRAGFPVVKVERKENENYSIEVYSSYLIQSPFFFLISVNLRQTFLLRPAVGTWYRDAFSDPSKDKNEEETGEEEQVYVTMNGKVYHRSKACSFISVSIRETTENQVYAERNRDGKKYKECTICNGEIHTGFVYITDYGEYFHWTSGCRALQRLTTTKPLSEVGNLRPCSKCARK